MLRYFANSPEIVIVTICKIQSATETVLHTTDEGGESMRAAGIPGLTAVAVERRRPMNKHWAVFNTSASASHFPVSSTPQVLLLLRHHPYHTLPQQTCNPIIRHQFHYSSASNCCCHQKTSSFVSTTVKEDSELIGLSLLQRHHSPPPPPPTIDTTSMEARIEKVIYNCRFMTFLAIAGSLLGSILCFLKGCIYVMDSFTKDFLSGGNVILVLVEAIDMYLIGTVMLVFGMGLYGLFVSNLDISKTSFYGSNLLGLFRLPERPKWLEVQSINELETKLGHAIVMVLLVGLFEKSKKVTICSSVDLFCFATSVLLSSGCLYLLSMLHSSKGKHASNKNQSKQLADTLLVMIP